MKEEAIMPANCGARGILTQLAFHSGRVDLANHVRQNR